jgi:hypothetical protein
MRGDVTSEAQRQVARRYVEWEIFIQTAFSEVANDSNVSPRY